MAFPLIPLLLGGGSVGKLNGNAAGLPNQTTGGGFLGTGQGVGNILTSPFRPRPIDLSPINTNYNENQSNDDYTVIIIAFVVLLMIGGGFAYFITRK